MAAASLDVFDGDPTPARKQGPSRTSKWGPLPCTSCLACIFVDCREPRGPNGYLAKSLAPPVPGPLSALTSHLPLIDRGGLPLFSLPGLSDDVKTGHGGERTSRMGLLVAPWSLDPTPPFVH